MLFRHFTKQVIIAWAYVIVSVLLIVGAFCLYDVLREFRYERRAFALLAVCKDPLVFEDFIAKYPDSKRVPDVRKRYLAILGEQAKWESVVKNATHDELVIFISNNPGRISLVQLANERIDTMDWRSAQDGASMRSMERYMEDHPEGTFFSAAEVQYKKYERLEFEAELRARLEAESRAAEEADTFSLEFAGAEVR